MLEMLAFVNILTAILVVSSVLDLVSAAHDNTSPAVFTQGIGNTDVVCVGIAVVVFLVSWLATSRHVSEATVSGLMMAIVSFVWWNIRINPDSSQVVLWT